MISWFTLFSWRYFKSYDFFLFSTNFLKQSSHHFKNCTMYKNKSNNFKIRSLNLSPMQIFCSMLWSKCSTLKILGIKCLKSANKNESFIIVVKWTFCIDCAIECDKNLSKFTSFLYPFLIIITVWKYFIPLIPLKTKSGKSFLPRLYRYYGLF